MAVRVSVNYAAFDAEVISALRPIVDAQARAIAKTATDLAKRELGRYDFARTFAVGAYRNGFVVTGGPPVALGWAASVVNTAPHAEIIETGSRPHEIVAKKGGMLRFVTKAGPQYRRRVMHPGTRAYRILQRAGESTPFQG